MTEHKKCGGQPGNQNARTHGNYSRILSPHEAQVLKAVAALDAHGQRVLLKYLLMAESSRQVGTHSSRTMREKPERIPGLADFNCGFCA